MTAQTAPIIVGVALCVLIAIGCLLAALAAKYRKTHLPTFGSPRRCDGCGRFSHTTLYDAGYGYRWLCDSCKGRQK